MAGYNPYYNPYQMPMMPQQPPQPQQSQNLIRVQGIESAKAYPVAPGCSVPMLDIEAPFLYVKSVGMDGVPFPLRRFRVSEESEQQQAAVPDWKTELDKVNARLDKLEGGLNHEQPSA